MRKSGLFSLAALALAAPAAHTATITHFQDDFSTVSGALNGTTPDTTTAGATWVGPTTILANGSITSSGTTSTGAGTATLAFTPTVGRIYTIDASFTGITTSTDWIALGFAKGQSTSNNNANISTFSSSTGENRFLEHATVGVAWMFARGTDSRAILGDPGLAPATNGTNPGTLNGAGSVSWVGGPTGAGNYDLRIVLDTTAPTWTATWFAKAAADSSYTTVRGTTDLVSTDITSVGFGKSGNGATATIESFTLTSIPEPSAALLGGLGMLALLRRRR